MDRVFFVLFMAIVLCGGNVAFAQGSGNRATATKNVGAEWTGVVWRKIMIEDDGDNVVFKNDRKRRAVMFLQMC